MKYVGGFLLATGAGLLCYFGGNFLPVLWFGSDGVAYDGWAGPPFAVMQSIAGALLFYAWSVSEKARRWWSLRQAFIVSAGLSAFLMIGPALYLAGGARPGLYFFSMIGQLPAWLVATGALWVARREWQHG